MVRPIDLQDALSKTQAVLKVTEGQRANPENEQRMALIIADQKHKDDQKKPEPTQHSDEVILHRDKPDEKDKRGSGHKETDEDIGAEDPDAGAQTKKQRSDDEPLPPPTLDITV